MSEETGQILVVDDNRVNRIKLSISLESQGHQVGLAEDGQQALEMLREQDYDVVLLDIVMPGMDGFQVLEKMKADPNLRDIPVIVISALDEVDSAVRCIEIGAEDYLPKPFNAILLKARLHASLQKKKLRDLEKAYLHQEMALRQNEKLATLGKLSAGLAHELNNPAAAVQRGADQLDEALDNLKQAQLGMADQGFSPAELQTILELGDHAQAAARKHPEADDLSGKAWLVRSDLEAETERWLEMRGVHHPWEYAPSLVGIDVSLNDLESFNAKQLAGVVEWLHSTYRTSMLVDEIGMGAGRISELVRALKSYTYLDQAPLQSVNIHQGLEDTLVILRSKLKRGITMRREYASDLPEIQAYGSELNQVWTNIIDNAIDALLDEESPTVEPTITIRTFQENGYAIVEVEDNGPGIPPEAMPRLFDPFFTTKAPGKGSGLGLNISHNIIVQKHKGQIGVDSRAGNTRFRVRLPIQAGA
jgi:signal transduction histidine kinase